MATDQEEEVGPATRNSIAMKLLLFINDNPKKAAWQATKNPNQHGNRHSRLKPQTSSQGPSDNIILGKPFEDVRLQHTIGKELGRGQFGVTYLCTEISTGKKYACKSISKRKLVTKNDKEDIKREIQIMQHLSGQPNIVEFKGRYEDKQSVHVCMELGSCLIGSLPRDITVRGQLLRYAGRLVMLSTSVILWG